MQNGGSYIKDSNDLKSKIESIDIPNDALLVTTDVVGLYPSIPHEAGLSDSEKLWIKELVKRYLLKILLKWKNLF